MCLFVVLVMIIVMTTSLLVEGQSYVQGVPVAPDVLTTMESSAQSYLIGVISFFLFAVTVFLGVAALMKVDYSNDSLLMVEVPEPMMDSFTRKRRASAMQFAAKLLLEDKNDFFRLVQNPSLCLENELIYTDYFFDTPLYLLQQDFDVLRLRLPVSTTGAQMGGLPSLTLKDHNRVESGDQSSFVYSLEGLPEVVVKELLAGVDPLEVLTQHYSLQMTDPTSHVSTIIRRLESVENTTGMTQHLSIVGSTKTHRRVYKYVSLSDSAGGEKTAYEYGMGSDSLLRDVKFRLDETEFPFGTRYEVEVVVFSDPLNDVRVDLDKFLSSLSIKYSWSLESKSSHLLKYLKGMEKPVMEVKGARMCIESVEGYNEVLNWLTNYCQSASLLPFSVLSSQFTGNLTSQDINANEYFRPRGEMLLSSQGTRNLFTQSQQHWSQRTTISNADHNPSNCFHTNDDDDDYQEYQENYYFDDVLNGTLQMHYCFAELRCINQGAAFIFSLKRNQCVVNGSQSSTTNQTEISGDAARHLLRNPTEFLNTMWEHNNVARALWDEYGLRVLNVVAFYRTKRHVFKRPITTILPSWTRLEKQRHQMSDDDDFQTARWNMDEILSSSAMTGQIPSININLDYTLLDCTTPATHFSAIAAQAPSCAYATASSFSPTTKCVSLYEVEVTGITEDYQEPVKQWLTNGLRKRGVELRTVDRTRVQKYMDILFQRQQQAT